jgi:hypothetical protein
LNNKEVLLTNRAKSQPRLPASAAAPSTAPRKSQVVRRDNIETSRDVQEAREAPPTAPDVSTAILAARAVATSAAQRPPPSTRTKKRIITPEMVKRRNINVRHPLVMKSDESHSGKESVVTEQTEKASNKKDAKKRQKAYASFGGREGRAVEIRKKGSVGAAVAAGGRGERLEIETSKKASVADKELPPLLPVKVAMDENDSRFANKKKDIRGVEKKLGNKAVPVEPLSPHSPIKADADENDSLLANKKKQIRGVEKKLDNKEVTVEPDQFEEDALLLKKRVPSGQSCSAFFISDASSASPDDDTKKDNALKNKTTPKGKSPTKLISKLSSPSVASYKVVSLSDMDTSIDAELIQSYAPSTSDQPIESAALLDSQSSEPITPPRSKPKSKSSSLRALKSQLLALSSQAKSIRGNVPTDPSLALSDEPSKSIETEVVIEVINQSESIEAADTIEEQKTNSNNCSRQFQALEDKCKYAEETSEQKIKVSEHVEAPEENGEDVKAIERTVNESNECSPEVIDVCADNLGCDSSNEVKPSISMIKDEHLRQTEGKASAEDLSNQNVATTPKTEIRRVDVGKKRQMTMTSFLGKQSKVIDEDIEYMKEEEDDWLPVVMDEDRYVGLKEQASDEIMDIHLQATLSDCEFSSVQSSVTTDKAFETQPSFIKRTSSLIRNPLLRRNRSKKKSDIDEFIQCMNNGKLAAKEDNNKVEGFDKPTRDQKRLKSRTFAKDAKKEKAVQFITTNNTMGGDEYDEEDKTPSVSTEQVNSEDIEEMYEDTSKVQEYSSNNHRLEKHHGTLPDVDTSAKVDVRSPSFRMSAISGSGTGLNSPLAQQILLNALNERAQNNPLLQKEQTDARDTVRNVPSVDNGTQTSIGPYIENVTYPLIRDKSSNNGFDSNSEYPGAPASGYSSGTFGDMIETIGLFSARLCLGTGAAIVSCSRACNDHPKSEVRQVSLGNGSFVEPDVGAFIGSPRNVAVLSPRNAVSFSPRNEIFRDGPRSPVSATNGYTQALADAISKMPEEEQLNLVRQLSSRSNIISPRSADMDDMVSSVDGMFRQRGMSRMKRVPQNIAAKPKPSRRAPDVPIEHHKTNQPSDTKPTNTKKPFRGLRSGIKRLAKTRLTVMYQV